MKRDLVHPGRQAGSLRRACCNLVSACLLTAPLAGCFFSQVYPHDWSKLSVEKVGSCPAIAGRYRDTAIAATNSSWEYARRHTGRTPAGWNGSQSLAENLGGLGSATWVEIEQPDPDTLVVVANPASDGASQFQSRLVLAASRGDFSCDSGGLRFSGGVASVFGGRNDLPTAGRVAVTTMFVFAGTAGAHTHQRVFHRAQNGDLIMEVKEGEAVIVLYVVPMVTGENMFVRWPRYEPEVSPAQPPASEPSVDSK